MYITELRYADLRCIPPHRILDELVEELDRRHVRVHVYPLVHSVVIEDVL